MSHVESGSIETRGPWSVLVSTRHDKNEREEKERARAWGRNKCGAANFRNPREPGLMGSPPIVPNRTNYRKYDQDCYSRARLPLLGDPSWPEPLHPAQAAHRNPVSMEGGGSVARVTRSRARCLVERTRLPWDTHDERASHRFPLSQALRPHAPAPMIIVCRGGSARTTSLAAVVRIAQNETVPTAVAAPE
jgi:hypothetical protein